MKQSALYIKQATYWVSVGMILILLSLSVAWIISSALSADSPHILFGQLDLLTYMPYLALGLILSILGLLFTAGNPLKQHTLRWNFEVNMLDVARAYAAVHAADRQGVFKLHEQFDAVRERMKWLKSHPELAGLETDVLLLAAQLSEVTSSLALRYNDDDVDRAMVFLAQRNQECERLEALVAKALEVRTTIQLIAQDVQLRTEMASSQLNGIHEELQGYLEPLGFEVKRKKSADIIPMSAE